MMALLVAVLDIVMDQREVVYQLNGCCRGQRAVPFAAGRFARQQAERRTQRLAAGVFWLPLGVLPAEVIANHMVEQPRLLVAYEGAQIFIEPPPVTGHGRDGQQLLSDEVDDDLAVPAVIELHKKEALPRPEGKPAIHDRHGFTRA